MYARFFKRLLDFCISLILLIILSPVMITLIIIGAVIMRGNPFFVQERPGWHEKYFKLIKFRTMTNKKDEQGNLLPDEERLTAYGIFLRSTSLDELPEFINILIGDMSFVGPRPLLVQYLPRYSEEQHKRHNVRPGLTGLAQVNGRNAISWEEKFDWDIKYVEHITLAMDWKIVTDTIKTVIKRESISASGEATMPEFMGSKR